MVFKMSRYPKANDKGIPEDELVVAKLIQNAAARCLVSNRGLVFKDAKGNAVGPVTDVAITRIMHKKLLANPPKGAVACCALGAACMTEDTGLYLDHDPVLVTGGNDASDYGQDYCLNEQPILRLISIGRAFEQALRPDFD